MRIPFVGPSYELRTRKADAQRSINLFPSLVESGTGKVPAILQSVPGYDQFSDLTDEIRGFCVAQGRMFAVAGNVLYEISGSGTATNRGTLNSSTGPVGIDKNRVEVIITDGDGYIFNLAGNTFTQITSGAFLGSDLVSVVNGVAVYKEPDTDRFYWSSVDDAGTINALDFFTAENSPDGIVGHIVDHGQLFLFGEEGTEVWDYVGGTDEFSRNSGAQIQVGAIAKHSIRQLDNSIFWLGQDKHGSGSVWKMNGYTPARVSTQAVEQALSTGTMSDAVAFTYQMEGHSFYCLNVPGLDTTWCFDASTSQWHERAEFSTDFTQSHKHHVYAYGQHFVGGDDGKVYRLDTDLYQNSGAVLCRERISPHLAQPNLERMPVNAFQVECDTGEGTGGELLMVCYSKNGGKTWSDWIYPSLGATGRWNQRVRLLRLGFARDWVWRVRCTENVPFNIVGAHAE